MKTERIALAGGWLLLVAVVAWTGYQTQQSVARVEAIATEVRIDTCGAWLGTYQFMNVWAAQELSRKEATWVRERFALDFKQHCADYDQALPGEQS